MNRSVRNGIYRTRDLFDPLSVELDSELDICWLWARPTTNPPLEFSLCDPEMISTCRSGSPVSSEPGGGHHGASWRIKK